MEENKNVSGNDKLMGVLCYLGILIIIPFLMAKDSKFVKFHLNQGLILIVVGLIAYVAGWVPAIGSLVSNLLSIACFVLMIIGIVNVVQDKEAQLPIIGKYNLYK